MTQLFGNSPVRHRAKDVSSSALPDPEELGESLLIQKAAAIRRQLEHRKQISPELRKKVEYCYNWALSLINQFGFPRDAYAELKKALQLLSSGKDTITKVKGGYEVKSEHGNKNLGGPYKSKAAAAKRLGQVEYFKHKH